MRKKSREITHPRDTTNLHTQANRVTWCQDTETRVHQLVQQKHTAGASATNAAVTHTHTHTFTVETKDTAH